MRITRKIISISIIILILLCSAIIIVDEPIEQIESDLYVGYVTDIKGDFAIIEVANTFISMPNKSYQIGDAIKIIIDEDSELLKLYPHSSSADFLLHIK